MQHMEIKQQAYLFPGSLLIKLHIPFVCTQWKLEPYLMGCRWTATSHVDPLQRSALGAYKSMMATVATWRPAGAWRCCVLAFSARRGWEAPTLHHRHLAPVRTHVRWWHPFIDAARVPTHKNRPLRCAMHLIPRCRCRQVQQTKMRRQLSGDGWSMLRCLDPGESTTDVF
jgi:hypothetical protein